MQAASASLEGFPVRLLLLACLLIVPAAGADIYRWTDADGRIHYSDKPPADRKAKQVKIPVQSITGPATVSAAQAQAPAGAAVGARTPVQIFTTAWCGYCRKAKAQLAARGVPYREVDVEGSDSGRREFASLRGRGVPVILVGSQRMDGYDATRLDAMLGQAGY
jgi:glutaredoxin